MSMHEVIGILDGLNGKVSARISKKIDQILALALPYRYLGARFSFKMNGDLDKEVNQLLLDLSNAIYADFEGDTKKAIGIVNEDDDTDAILAYTRRNIEGKDTIERLDGYASQLKYYIEGMIAIGFANKMGNADIISHVKSYYRRPYADPLARKAFTEPMEYTSNWIASRGFHLGNGVSTDVVKGMANVGEYMINEAYQYATILDFRKMGAKGYVVRRGSDYDCMQCDELTIGVHPLDEIVLPSHVHCRCYAEPVFV